MKYLPSIIALLTLLFAAAGASAQVDTTTAAPVRVELTDGSTLIGTIERETDEVVYFRTTSGVEMRLPRDRIKSREKLSGRIVDGAYRRYDPNRTRLFFAPTARAIGAERGYVAAYELFFPFLAAGVGDAVSLAGGFSLIPGAEGQLVYAAPKVTFVQTQQTHLAVGVIAGTILGPETGGGFGGLAFGLGTFGGAEQSVTVGAGLGHVAGEQLSETSHPLLLVGGEDQVSNSIKVLTENYIYFADDVTIIFSGGIRFFNDTLAADLGLFSSPELIRTSGGRFPFLPWLGFAYNFSD